MSKLAKLIKQRKDQVSKQEDEMLDLSNRMQEILDIEGLKTMHDINLSVKTDKYTVGTIHAPLKTIYGDERIYILVALHSDDNTPVESIDFDDLLDSLSKWAVE